MPDTEFKIKYLLSNDLYDKVEYLNMISSPVIFKELYLKTNNVFLRRQIIKIARHADIYNLGLKETIDSIRIEVIRCINQDLHAKWALEDKKVSTGKEISSNVIPITKIRKRKLAKAEAEKRAKAEAEKRAKAEAEKLVKAEAEKLAKAEAEKLAKAEAEKLVKKQIKIIRRPQNQKRVYTSPNTTGVDKHTIQNIYDINTLICIKDKVECKEDIDKQIDIVCNKYKILHALDKRKIV